jgi:putative nucleotidyltransferase with HDIG domain
MFTVNRKLSRLGQWDGRRRSSRSDEPVLSRIWRGAVLLRLATVMGTMIVITLLAYRLGPPVPYRLGEVYPTDLRVRTYFEVVNRPQTELAREEAEQRLPSSSETDPATREEAKQAVAPIVERYPVGVPLVRRGQPVTLNQLVLLRDEQIAYFASLQLGDHLRRASALFLVMSLLAGVVVLYCVRFQQALAGSLTKILSVCALAVLTLICGLHLSGPPWHASLVPLTVAAMIVAIAYNPQFALLMSVCQCLALAVAQGTNLDQLLIQLGGQATAVLLLRSVRTRTRLVHVGISAGVAYFAMTVAAGLFSDQTWYFILREGSRHFVMGGLAGFLLSGSLPLVERCFGILTDVSLLELADGSHPLLQELLRRAPGTYTHSITVATLAESAAEAIGANPLLARVGSYFHDVGKMLKPQYFIENQNGENRHDALEPALSTLVIIGHIKDGMELARQYHLPPAIAEFICQHHGTTLVEYFYREAVRLQEDEGQVSQEELENRFRYPGPKPRSREIAVVMAADAVESASRALRDPAPGSLSKLVHDLLMKRLLDGQFEESGLTLTELHRIEESLSKNLIALFHARIRYAEENDAAEEGARRAS